MAGSSQNHGPQRPRERVVPHIEPVSSQVSKAVGGVGRGGSSRMQNRQVEQRSSISSRQSTRSPSASRAGSPGVVGDVGSSRTVRGASRQASQAAGNTRGATTRAGSSTRAGSTRTSSTRSGRAAPAPSEPRDVRAVQWMHDKWSGLEPHQQHRVTSIALLCLSLLLFASLTIFQNQVVFSSINHLLLAFFGWTAFFVVLGLIAYSLTRLIEGIQQKRLLRKSLVIGVIVLWLLILIESRLIVGSPIVGILAEILSFPFINLTPVIGHLLIICGILITIILTFRISFAHILLVAYALKGILTTEPHLDGDEADGNSSAFRGQRPKFSRFVSPEFDEDAASEETLIDPQALAARANAQNAAGPRMRRRLIDEEPVEDYPVNNYSDGYAGDGYADDNYGDDNYNEPTIAIDDGYHFDEDDDPHNDINLHRHSISNIPRGSNIQPRGLDLQDHRQAVRGAHQQPLAFDVADEDEEEEVASSRSGRVVLRSSASYVPDAIEDEEPPRPSRRPGPRAALTPPEVSSYADPVLSPAVSPKPVRKSSSSRSAKARVAQIETVEAVSQPDPQDRLLIQRQSTWKVPGTTILNSPDTTKLQIKGEDTATLAKLIQDTLRSFRVDAEVRAEDISIGPTVIRFGIRPTGKVALRKDEQSGKMIPVVDSAGQPVYESRTRVSRIMALQNDLALVLEAKTIRMEAPVPGRPYVGVEIPNKNSRLVTLREVLESKEYEGAQKKSKLAIGLGKDVAGIVRVADLARMPHVLIAGATGAGKSVQINTIIASILTQATPDDVRLLMVDPKMVELNMYDGIPHLLSPVVIEVDKVVALLKNAIHEMERRYRLFSQLGVRNLDAYRKMRTQKIQQGDNSLNNLPAIVIIIDELADLMMAAPEEVESMICRLAQLARATGIHLVVATQRPSVDVITGLIKANIPTRISFMVSSAVDSRTIIDSGGAERLLGRGDMLYLAADAGRPERIQGAFLSDEEAHALADYWRQQITTRAQAIGEEPQTLHEQLLHEAGWEERHEPEGDAEPEDELLERAEDIVREYGRASISLLQRRLKIGYSRAARLIDLLEEHGIIGQFERSGKAREVYQGGNGGSGEHSRADSLGDGHSMADEVDDIVAEEKARDDFLRKQAARFKQPSYNQPEADDYVEDDEEDV